MEHPFLDPNRPLPRLLGKGLDAIIEKKPLRQWPVAPSEGDRRQRYWDALAADGSFPAHEKREVHGAELQANLRAYGTTIDLFLLAQAMCREEMVRRARERKGDDAMQRGILSLRKYRGDWAKSRG
jgi:hypothetical protein